MAKLDQPEEVPVTGADGGHTAKMHQELHGSHSFHVVETGVGKDGKPGVMVYRDQKDVADDMTRGGEAAFINSQHKMARHQAHLPENASSEQLYHAMAHSGFQAATNPKMNPEYVQDSLKTLGLKKEGLTEDKFFDALVAFHRKEAGVSPSASFEELELASHKKLYKDLKMGTLPVDKD